MNWWNNIINNHSGTHSWTQTQHLCIQNWYDFVKVAIGTKMSWGVKCINSMWQYTGILNFHKGAICKIYRVNYGLCNHKQKPTLHNSYLALVK